MKKEISNTSSCTALTALTLAEQSSWYKFMYLQNSLWSTTSSGRLYLMIQDEKPLRSVIEYHTNRIQILRLLRILPPQRKTIGTPSRAVHHLKST